MRADGELARVVQPAGDIRLGYTVGLPLSLVFGVFGLFMIPRQPVYGVLFLVGSGVGIVVCTLGVKRVRGDQTTVLYEDRIEVMNGDQARTYPLESITSINYDDRWNGQKPLFGSKTYFITTKSGIIRMPQTDEGLAFARKLADLVKFGYP